MHDDAAVTSGFGLAHHFDSFDQQREASFLGMWVFLLTEVMFFGGLFTAYIVYRMKSPSGFHGGSHELDIVLGAVNTVVLISSSLSMALSVRFAQLGKRMATVWSLILTIILGSAFLGIKAIEYAAKFEHHLVPGPGFLWHGADAPGAEMFFSLYFAMTGLHALHMVIGIGLLAVMAVFAWQGKFSADNHNLVEGSGLYWHFVDIVWIFLFPLLYLLGRS